MTSRVLEGEVTVSTPAFGDARYDVTLDDGTTLERAQVKTARPHPDHRGTVVVEFQTTVYDSDGTPNRFYYTGEEIDVYLAYCPDRDTVLYVSFEETPKTQMNVSFRDRSTYDRGNQKAVNFAGEYRLTERL